MSGQRQNWIDEAELHAYLDGELEAERRRAVEAALAKDAGLAARVASYRRHGALIKRAYGLLLERPVPPAMLRTLSGRARAATPRRWPRVIAAMAAALALLIAGAGSGWWLRGALTLVVPAEQRFVEDAVSAHLVYAAEVRHPVEVGAEQQDHLMTWLSHRLNLPLEAPDLSRHGYQLIGGRLLPAEVGPAAQLMYENAGGRRLTLYVRQSGAGGETAFRFTTEGDVSACYWREDGAGWALLGELPRNQLLAIAHTVYQALNS